jgi:hypothetical protein
MNDFYGGPAKRERAVLEPGVAVAPCAVCGKETLARKRIYWPRAASYVCATGPCDAI